MNAEDRQQQRLQLLDDSIAQAMREIEARGELRQAPSFGKPFGIDDGYERTPAELRMGYKILKDAGVLPPEVELMRAIALQEQALTSMAEDDPARAALRRQILDGRQHLALRLEKLRATGSL